MKWLLLAGVVGAGLYLYWRHNVEAQKAYEASLRVKSAVQDLAGSASTIAADVRAQIEAAGVNNITLGGFGSSSSPATAPSGLTSSPKYNTAKGL
jgi:hypothetical protein